MLRSLACDLKGVCIAARTCVISHMYTCIKMKCTVNLQVQFGRYYIRQLLYLRIWIILTKIVSKCVYIQHVFNAAIIILLHSH